MRPAAEAARVDYARDMQAATADVAAEVFDE
jgi:hypothetical protein